MQDDIEPVPREDHRSSFRLRLAALLGVLLVLMALITLLALKQLSEVSQTIDSVYKDRLLPMQQLRLVSNGFSVDLNGAVQRLALRRELSMQQVDLDLREIEQRVRSQWASYRETVLVDREKTLIAKAEPSLARGFAAIRRLRLIASEGDGIKLQAFLSTELQPAVAEIAAVMDDLMQVQIDVGRQADDDSQADFAQAVWLVGALLLLTLALGLGLGWSVLHSQRSERARIEAHRARAQRFYHSLTLSNQLVMQSSGSAHTLYEGVCRICVDMGLARGVALVLIDGEQDRPVEQSFACVATAGPVEGLMPGLPERWRGDAPFAIASICSEALGSGEPALANHLLADSRMPLWRASVIPPGLAAMAAFPLRRSGRWVGALVLLAGTQDFFDADLVQLLDELSENLGFGLDNLDRERARLEASARAETERALFQRLFDSSAIACAVSTLDEDRLLEVNEVLCQRLGCSRAELLGRSLAELRLGLGGGERTRFRARLEAEGQVRNFEADVHTRDRGLRRVLLNGDLIDYQGQACVLTSSVDVTDVGSGLGQNRTGPASRPYDPR